MSHKIPAILNHRTQGRGEERREEEKSDGTETLCLMLVPQTLEERSAGWPRIRRAKHDMTKAHLTTSMFDSGMCTRSWIHRPPEIPAPGVVCGRRFSFLLSA